jgi:feruloyl esterase
LNALRVADLTVTEATSVPATPAVPGHCAVTGTVVTRGEGAPNGLARFSMQLPGTWRQRFLFLGVGGNAGTLQPSANAVDRAAALGKGYAVVLTDTGHVGDGTSANWVRKPDGSLDQAAVTDFLFRAAHDVTVAGKAFAHAYYAAPIERAYFDGCSTGGRMALAAAIHYPDDYHGVISGDPAMDYNLNLARMALQKALLSKPASYIPPATIEAIDARITRQCDALDGAKDGLVQDPMSCTVKPADLTCKTGQSGDCLTADQVDAFKAYVEPLRDRRGRVAYPGWPIAHLVGPQGPSYYAFGRMAPNMAQPQAPWGEDERNAPRSWRLALESLTDWLGYGPSATLQHADVDGAAKTVGDELFARTRSIMGAGEATDPTKLLPFFTRGGKLVLYHGMSEPSITPVRTTMFYDDLVSVMKGQQRAQASARLFLVPGMHHCGGGAGPDQFDTLSALEAWVEQGKAPVTILAKTRPNASVPRELPLCPYPQQARYDGKGAMSDASNWSCAVPNTKRPAP